jgi:hypothetical protein
MVLTGLIRTRNVGLVRHFSTVFGVDFEVTGITRDERWASVQLVCAQGEKVDAVTRSVPTFIRGGMRKSVRRQNEHNSVSSIIGRRPQAHGSH